MLMAWLYVSNSCLYSSIDRSAHGEGKKEIVRNLLRKKKKKEVEKRKKQGCSFQRFFHQYVVLTSLNIIDLTGERTSRVALSNQCIGRTASVPLLYKKLHYYRQRWRTTNLLFSLIFQGLLCSLTHKKIKDCVINLLEVVKICKVLMLYTL